MIRTACFAFLATVTMLTGQSANAAVNLNDQISKIVYGLQKSKFSARDFSLKLSNGQAKLFTGIEGVRFLNPTDIGTLNDWVGEQPSSNTVFDGGSYNFTHSVLGSFFDSDKKTDKAPDPIFNGAPYKFTHSVLDSYFKDPAASQRVMLIEAPLQSLAAPAAVPEPATWATMIGGFALAGAALRNRRRTVRAA